MTEIASALREGLADRYRIERELGAGGMATVYLAHDLRHDRKVALKVLRDDLTASLGKERFLREINIAAGLTHPHVLPLHDSGEVAGQLYYVMPFVDGQSLRQKLARDGELPVAEALRILRDVADALSEAHRLGVVHRDLKPENVMLRGRHALVADFGVAKALSEATGRHSLTTVGVALGTPTYMSPEQATADPHVDHRSDVYAFGVLAYELLAGVPPFVGNTPQEVLAAHVTRAPVSVHEHRPSLAPALTALVMRCLEKKPADRWQSAEDLVSALESLMTPSGGITPTNTAPVASVAGPAAAPRARRRAWLVAGAVAVIALVAYGAWRWDSPPPMPTVRRQLAVTATRELEVEPALSPDGKFLAYVQGPLDAARVMVRQVSMGSAVPISPETGQPSERQPQWIDDGVRVAFLRDGSVWAAPALGGAATALLSRGDGPAIVDFSISHAGDRIAVVRGGRFVVLALDGNGDSTLLDLQDASAPRWSPDDRWIAAVSKNSGAARGDRGFGNLAASAVWILSADGRERRLISDSTSANSAPAWGPGGRALVFVSTEGGSRDLHVRALDARPRPIGAVRRLTTGALPMMSTLSADGRTLVYSSYVARSTVWRVPLQAQGPSRFEDGEQLTFENALIENMRPAARGQWLYYDAARDGAADLYRVRIGSREPERLTDHPANEFMPQLSPDGRTIVFQSQREGTRDVVLMDANGGALRPLAATLAQENYPTWSPAGDRIAFLIGGSVHVIARGPDGAWGEPRLVGKDLGVAPTWTPDGRAIVSVGAGSIVRADVESGRLDTLYTGNGRDLPLALRAEFDRDAGVLYFKSFADGVTSFWRVSGAARAPVEVLRLDRAHPSYRADFAVESGYLYFAVDDRQGDLWSLELAWPD